MKTFLLATCALFCSAAALFSQASTVQVTVTDTIEVPANHLSVMITFKDTSYERETPIDLSASRDAVIRLLDANKISWKNAGDQMGFLGALAKMADNGKTETDLSADFSSAAQLDALLLQLKAIPYVTAVETGSSVDKDLLDLSRLYAKLFKKAQTKAEMLARLSGKKAGAVYQIGSPFDAFNPANAMDSMMGGGSPYGDLMKSMLGGMFSEKRADHKVTIKEQLTVSFLLQ